MILLQQKQVCTIFKSFTFLSIGEPHLGHSMVNFSVSFFIVEHYFILAHLSEASEAHSDVLYDLIAHDGTVKNNAGPKQRKQR
jgi:hypothetical protein